MKSAALFLALVSCHCARPDPLPAAQVFERLSRAAVIVRAKHPEKGPDVVAQGSGTVIGLRGGYYFVLTAAHVFPPTPSLIAVCAINDAGEGDDVRGTLEDIDRDTDLALVVVKAVPEIIRAPIPVARTEPAMFGVLYSFSSPGHMPYTATTAILTRRRLPQRMWALWGFAYYGGSGGTLANDRGELVGVIKGITAFSDDGVTATAVPEVWYAVSLGAVRDFVGKHAL